MTDFPLQGVREWENESGYENENEKELSESENTAWLIMLVRVLNLYCLMD